jgi:transposase-like protein
MARSRRRERAVRALSFKRLRCPPDVIRHAVWLYFGSTLSFREVEELLARRGIEVCYETIRRGRSSSARASPGT